MREQFLIDVAHECGSQNIALRNMQGDSEKNLAFEFQIVYNSNIIMNTQKNICFQELARIGKALADPRRLAIIEALCQRPYAVEELADAIGATVAATSHHLQILKAARMADAQVDGQRRIYRLRKEISGLWSALTMAGNANLSEIRVALAAFANGSESFESVGLRELRMRVKAGQALVIDVRPEPEYAAAHFPGAVSIPMEHLEARLRDLPHDREIVAYCRGPYCVLSHEAVECLRRHGFRARRWADGVADWKSAGIRLECASS